MFFGTWAGYIFAGVSLDRIYGRIGSFTAKSRMREIMDLFVKREREFFRRGDSVIFCFQICFKTVLHFTNAAGNFRHDDFLPRNLLHKDADKDGTEKYSMKHVSIQ